MSRLFLILLTLAAGFMYQSPFADVLDIDKFEQKYMGFGYAEEDKSLKFDALSDLYGNLSERYRNISTDSEQLEIFARDFSAKRDLGPYYLNIAIEIDSVESHQLIHSLIEYGVDPLEEDFSGVVPIVNAAFLSKYEIYRFLISRVTWSCDNHEQADFMHALFKYVSALAVRERRAQIDEGNANE